jgi:phosphoribosylamine-glycine ligase
MARVLGVVATSSSLVEAIDKVYLTIGGSIETQNLQYRCDIGKKGFRDKIRNG